MNIEQRKFIKVMKARKRRAAFLKNGRKVHAQKIDISRFIPKQTKREKQSFFQRMKNKIF